MQQPNDVERYGMLVVMVLLCWPLPASQAPDAEDAVSDWGSVSVTTTTAAASLQEDTDDVVPPIASMTVTKSSNATSTSDSTTSMTTMSTIRMSTTVMSTTTQVNLAMKFPSNALGISAADKLQPAALKPVGEQIAQRVSDPSKNKTVKALHLAENESVSESSHQQSSDNAVAGSDEDIADVLHPSNLTVTPNLLSVSSNPAHSTSSPLSASTILATLLHTASSEVESETFPQGHPPSFHNDHIHHHNKVDDHVENVRGPGPYFRPPSAISRRYHKQTDEEAVGEDWEFDPSCWPRCDNVTSPEGPKRKRKHSSYKHKKFHNYKLLYDTLKQQGSLQRRETEFYAWIFGATMLSLGSLTTLTSCIVFCVCGEKIKKKKQKRKSKDKYGQYYQRVDSVSSMVDGSHIDPQDYIEQLDSVTII